MTVWIQRQGRPNEEMKDPSLDSVWAYLRSFDREVQDEVDTEASGDDCDARSIGMVHEAGHLLHIVPGGTMATWICHYHYPIRQRRILGIFGKAVRMGKMSFRDVKEKDMLAVIKAHFSGNHGTVMNRLAQKSTRIQESESKE